MKKSKGEELFLKDKSEKSPDQIWSLLFTAILLPFHFIYFFYE
jgi:hypothetical protein